MSRKLDMEDDQVSAIALVIVLILSMAAGTIFSIWLF